MGDCKRILQVVSILNRGGIENMLMNLYRNMDRKKIQFDFVAHHNIKGQFDDEIKALGGRIFYSPNYNVLNHFRYKKWWKNFLQEHPEYKIVHSHSYTKASVHLKVAKKLGLITIVHSHSASYSKGVKGIIERISQKSISSIPDYLFACSQKAGEWLYGEKCVRNENYVVLNNAIDCEKYKYNSENRKNIRQELNIEDKFIVGHVGSFSIPKNHRYLLNIFSEIKKKKENAVLLLVGDGVLRTEIERKISNLNLQGDVIMTGVRSDVSLLMQAMDCFVFPSLYEGLPVTVIEAQAAGLPCVLSNTITDEVCITDLVKALPIDIAPADWTEDVVMCDGYERKDMCLEIKKAGYDIDTTTEWLTDFYLNLQK